MLRKPVLTLVALVLLTVVVGSAAAAVPEEPVAFAMAQRGSFKLVANVLLSERGAEMKGVWLDAREGCLRKRTLRVAILVDLVNAAAKTTRVRRTRTGRVDNCAEGGPNFGFDLVPRRIGLGCANGRWKPGRYSLVTRVTDVSTGLVAQASLYRQVTRRC